MGKNIILKVENVSKQYRLGLVGTGTISHDLNRWWSKIRGKEDPYLKVGETNDRATKGSSDYVWALKNINFEVKKGEVLGIIGKNGAGKSTILKILSKVTSPTTGIIKTKGRIASLLEVGTGFHPEMTGRENVYLNGAILGMTKAEIDSKIDEIIEFSGCQRYIDTPVKRYSSGMTVRLAFAVAAHLEPEILVIDEVLAVGDAEFQKKAIGKMQDISSGDGRTVLFVSHNMESIQKLCTRCIVLKDGAISFEGDVKEAVSYYLRAFEKESKEIVYPLKANNAIIDEFGIMDSDGREVFSLVLGNPYSFQVGLNNLSTKKEINIKIKIFDKEDSLYTSLNTFHNDKTYKINVGEKVKINCHIDNLNFVPGTYYLGIEIMDLVTNNIIFKDDKLHKFVVEKGDFYGSGKLPRNKFMGRVLIKQNWQYSRYDFS